MNEPHEHKWEGLERWPMRYRCEIPSCGIIGYRGMVIASPDDKPTKRSDTIIPYVCTVKDCRAPAIVSMRRRGGKYQRCRGHYDRLRADRFRRLGK